LKKEKLTKGPPKKDHHKQYQQPKKQVKNTDMLTWLDWHCLRELWAVGQGNS